MKKLILLSLALGLLPSANAGHSLGSEITYKQIDSLKYIVSITKYRICSGTQMSNSQDLLVSCSSGSTIAKSLTRVSIEELKLHCSTNGSECTPSNTSITGSEGVERHLYSDTIDFASTTFSSLATCSSTIRFAMSECCRPSFVNTGGAATQYYNFAELNLAIGNSSADLTSDPHIFQCCSQPVYYNVGARDTIERDSISYSLACPQTGSGSISYSGSYSCSHPFQAYFPGSLSPPYSNPNASPPIGIYLDPVTGDLIFTPTSCNEISSWVIEATEWRKDTAGTPQIVGKTRRDVVSITSTCPDNNVPNINGPYTYTVCEGDQLCFNITTSDQVFTPPPPASTPAPDTVLLSWNEGVPGASFTIQDTAARLKTGRFCWTPPLGSNSDLPYTFTAMVDDDHCDINRKSYRAFSVRVKKRAEAAVNVTSLNCGWYDLNSQIDRSTFFGSPFYTWVILDSNSAFVFDKSIAYFKSSRNGLSSQNADSLKIQRAGTYIVEHSINNSPLNCSQKYRDTITVPALATTLIAFTKDTSVCTGSNIVLNSNTTNGTGTPSYQWFANDTLLAGETTTTLNINNFNSNIPIRYKIKLSDPNGCTNTDAVVIGLNAPYQDTLPSNLETCLGDTIHLSIDSSLLGVLWSNGSTSFEQHITQSEQLTLTYTDTLGCTYTDSSSIIIHPLPQLMLEDSTYCGTQAAISPGTFSSYLWNTGDTTSSVIASANGTYSVAVLDSNQCAGQDSAALIFLNNIAVDLGPDTTSCGPYVLQHNATGTYAWSTGATTRSIVANQSGTYSLLVTGSNGCTSLDSVDVIIRDLPLQTWGDTLSYCSDTLITLSSDPFSTYLWNNGTQTQSIQAANGPYSVTFTDSIGCSNKDTVYVKLNSIPEFSLGEDTTLCDDKLELSGIVGKSYLWSTGSINIIETAQTSGTYWLRVTDYNDCSFIDSIELELNRNSNTPILTKSGSMITSNQSGTHKWFKNSTVIRGQSQNTLTISGSGDYTALFVDIDDCESDTSNTITRTAGITKLKSSPLKIYPNPTNGQVTIDAAGLGNIQSIKLFDAQGKLVENTQAINGSLIELVWTVKSGVLWVEVETESATYREQIITIK